MAKPAVKTYLWCDTCRRSYPHAEAPDGACPVCASPVRAMGRLAAITRGLMANELVASDLQTKHRQLIRLILEPATAWANATIVSSRPICRTIGSKRGSPSF